MFAINFINFTPKSLLRIGMAFWNVGYAEFSSAAKLFLNVRHLGRDIHQIIRIHVFRLFIGFRVNLSCLADVSHRNVRVQITRLSHAGNGDWNCIRFFQVWQGRRGSPTHSLRPTTPGEISDPLHGPPGPAGRNAPRLYNSYNHCQCATRL